MKVISNLFLACMLSFSTMAFGAEDEEMPSFKKADVDGNNFVDEQEFAPAKALVEKELSEFDENKDGKLSMSEYEALMEEECE